MDINVGSLDRAVRFVLGMAMIAFAMFFKQVPWSPLGWFGVYPLATALFSTCPFYSAFGFSTCPVEEDEL
jgi:hypothetical protein